MKNHAHFASKKAMAPFGVQKTFTGTADALNVVRWDKMYRHARLKTLPPQQKQRAP